MNSLSDTTVLSNGVQMPWMGLGVFKVEDGAEVTNAVKAAIHHGYRSIDTASFYDNEEGVGKAIQETAIPREELFITTKVWNSDQGYDSTLKAFDVSLRNLGLEYLDLYLIHWPVKGKYMDTWRALETLYKQGKVKAIGVSNFQIHHLKDLIEDGEIKPMVNQVEYHPSLTQEELHDYCKQQGIQLEAWSPLKKGRLMKDETIVALSEKYQKTPAQILLRWDLQNGVVTIPKSTKEHRIKENADIFDFNIEQEDMKRISSLNLNERTGADPDHFDF
ncbi:aldo/keto reductase [Rossellomorea vietnamensis]|uniref:Aldo/keto reductase n=1 Tax=Rossellomorea vietnamensis TaxID=218284 RepID=A0ACD4C458_9BACI|nr:aldo/keto reductase [Rossellomorea vietnamensis]UXH43318.1 aldo/keto reductase [Rossellomorea vietnamensis]